MRRVCFVLLALVLVAASLGAGNHDAYPLPEERGTAGILQALGRLPVYARVLCIQAHPDDESAGSVTWLAREAHANVTIYSLTRGEGGQNILGDEKYEALGLVRTGEFLEACRIYGAELRFGSAFDFGFSKTARETLEKWGHEAILEELTGLVRRWKPSVIISSFRGDPSDGHGHHQASGILAREAFHAAAESQRPGDHDPWQAAKFYQRGRGGGATEAGATVSIRVGDWNPVLGRSWREIGAEGYAKHRTQGAGDTFAFPGSPADFFRLVEPRAASPSPENGVFDGVDLSLRGVIDLAGKDRETVASLGSDLDALQQAAEEASRAFRPGRPAASLPALGRGISLFPSIQSKLEAAQPPQRVRAAVAEAVLLKKREFEEAVSAIAGVYVTATAGDATAIPGERVPVTVRFFNRGTEAVQIDTSSLQTPQGWSWSRSSGQLPAMVSPGAATAFDFAVQVPPDAAPTEVGWYRASPTDNRYRWRSSQDVPVITARLVYRISAVSVPIISDVRARAGDAVRGVDFVDFQIVPSLSVRLSPEVLVLSTDAAGKARELQALVVNADRAGAQGTLRLLLPEGWSSEPRATDFDLKQKGESFTARFRLQAPASLRAGSYPIQGIAACRGQEFRRGYRIISYPEIWTRYLYSPARCEVRAFDLKVAPNLIVGYVPGTGDEVPNALSQMGVRVEMLSQDDLAFADLARFGAIVTGIRAYNRNDALRMHNRRLLKYVEDGGTLIVQYNYPLPGGSGGVSPFAFGPFPMANTMADRITVEESPVQILAPQHPVFNAPNRITAADFDGWVQERGLFFMREWDPRYTPLVAGSDPGEAPLKGGMLATRHGKGWYVFTAYAWFRQLPAGVPGAYRIFANLISLGRTN